MAKQTIKKQGVQAITLLASFAASYLLYNMYLSKKLVKELREGNPK